ncbi:hypothetical protein BAUCODRAFT_127257 [Baudoinia panamericana UAMH 10762]|uniref:Uncharacterized protein n=1 Tax=Baudoinia panamericana (strain UAMH 10762) TaxID=717646 RepID=M2M440_BAUPA|nr:uncharacterized protein BAUCODRAFT_127257 [Baudoinia panamericana UAMH 10762]EMC91351.1 hypothetical protein BAUCODRAFT_127257 [Baudoinia panamericana UAMH 10762]
MANEELITDPLLLSVLDSAAQARRQSLAILDLIERYHGREGTPTEESTLNDQLTLSKQQKILNARLARLRGLNRKAILDVRATKQETAEARQEIDSLHLQLQNLYYEQRHLRGEIAACEDYDHRYKQLPMIPTEEFLERHPDFSESSEHDLTTARIQDEQVERQKLEEERQRLLKLKEALTKETTAKKDELGRLDAEIEKWLGGQESVRKLFEAREKKLAAQT